MTGCDGCGKILGFKKYKFHRMWRIDGKYCKDCMLELGKEFDHHGRITLPKARCELCEVDFYFLKPAGIGKHQKRCCHICSEAVKNEAIHDKSTGPQPNNGVPQVMMVFARLGVLMMALGLIYTIVVAPSSQGNLLGVLFGSATTRMGFVLFKKTIKSRNLILGKAKFSPPTIRHQE